MNERINPGTKNKIKAAIALGLAGIALSGCSDEKSWTIGVKCAKGTDLSIGSIDQPQEFGTETGKIVFGCLDGDRISRVESAVLLSGDSDAEAVQNINGDFERFNVVASNGFLQSSPSAEILANTNEDGSSVINLVPIDKISSVSIQK